VPGDTHHEPRRMCEVMQHQLSGLLYAGVLPEITRGVWVPIEVREIRRADLETNTMPPLEDSRGVAQINGVVVYCARCNPRRLLAGGPVTRPHDPLGNILRVAVQVDVHELGGEVGVLGRRSRP